MENKTFALCYAHMEDSASKEIRNIILQFPLPLILQDYINVSTDLSFLQFSRLLFIYLLKKHSAIQSIWDEPLYWTSLFFPVFQCRYYSFEM